MILTEKKFNFGFTFVDVTTNHFYLGEFEDDEHKRMLRTLIFRFKPVEIVYSKQLSLESISLLKHSSNKPTFSQIKSDFLPLNNIFNKICSYFSNEKDFKEEIYHDGITIPGIINEMRGAVQKFNDENNSNLNEEKSPFYLTLQALNLALNYLQQMLLDKTVFLMGNFELYDLNSEKSFTLFMDSQALLNLELLECPYQSKVFKKYTLFEYMDRTKTAFGKRLLEKWMLSPLKDIYAINDRLDAIEDLIKLPEVADYCQDQLAKLPDIERKLYRVCNFAQEKKLSADYFEYDYVNNRLKDFMSLLKDLKKTDEIVQIFNEYISKMSSSRLKQLVSFKSAKKELNSSRKSNKSNLVEGLMPKMSEIIKEVENMVIYIEDVPCPAPGIDQEYDAVLLQIEEIKQELARILEKEKKRFKNNKDICFVNSKYVILYFLFLDFKIRNMKLKFQRYWLKVRKGQKTTFSLQKEKDF